MNADAMLIMDSIVEEWKQKLIMACACDVHCMCLLPIAVPVPY
jgi:hypothetical protein